MNGSDSPQGSLTISEIEAKSLLNKSGIADWAINCYAGCAHACSYCYARFATRFTHPQERWGSFVDVKVNAPQLLVAEVRRKRVGRVFVSSVCDGWQPLEARYGLTRQCLEILLQHGYPVTILTKSALAARDFDLLAGKEGVAFGVTLTTLDADVGRLIEPQASSPSERLALLSEAKRRGIRSYAFLGPLMPGLSDTEEQLPLLLKAIKEAGVDYFLVDRLNLRYGVWQDLKGLLRQHFPHLVGRYQRILFEDRARMEYTQRLLATLHRLVAEHELEDRMKLCF